MSRVGKYPVALKNGATAEIKGQTVTIKGKNGSLTYTVRPNVEVKLDPQAGLVLSPLSKSKKDRSQWGTDRANLNNMVKGVTEGFSKTLEIEGVGFKAAVQGTTVVLNLGFSHEIRYPVPQGITVKAEKPTLLHITGNDRQVVGQVAAEIRGMKKPEPYKGKGIKYQGERILRKVGKKK
ncbi:MAG: 50S ribosomal protein L6 [Bdellovibrionales bacterium]